jgi:hypothetical protein
MHTSAFLLVLLSSVGVSSAWGPYSHYTFSCGARGLAVEKCDAALLFGSDLPDAFFFGAENASSAACAGLQPVHDLGFAGYLVKRAVATREPNLLQLALGFGAHSAADAVGFYPRHGYLSKSGSFSWTAVWVFMTAVDAALCHANANATAACGSVAAAPPALPPGGASLFVASANDYRAAAAPNFPNLTVAMVDECAGNWASNVGAVLRGAHALSLQGARELMLGFDVFGAASIVEAAAHLDLAAPCAVAAARSWMDAIQMGNVTAAAAAQSTYAFVASQFAAGACAPRNPL